ncbi:MAG TPA: SIS domain-containing protein [Flavobacteriales bacterium]|nr:SIS domain-containing protein [Flavobacteriales bacterium]
MITPTPKEFLTRYTGAMQELAGSIAASNANGSLPYAQAIEHAVEMVRVAQAANKKVIMIGNGGSAGIASHQAVDYWKNGGVRAVAFNDSSLLTCIGNDLGFENLFAAPIERFADPDDVVFAISSSGSSPNILNAAAAARKTGCRLVTFSGFAPDNKLRSLGDLNFHVASHSYGLVEILHLFIIHTILDMKLQCFDGRDVFDRNRPIG